eukprot:359074-Chlamydomonas_euryale.AAC.3
MRWKRMATQDSACVATYLKLVTCWTLATVSADADEARMFHIYEDMIVKRAGPDTCDVTTLLINLPQVGNRCCGMLMPQPP